MKIAKAHSFILAGSFTLALFLAAIAVVIILGFVQQGFGAAQDFRRILIRVSITRNANSVSRFEQIEWASTSAASK